MQRQLGESRADCRAREQELERLRSAFAAREKELLTTINAREREAVEVREHSPAISKSSVRRPRSPMNVCGLPKAGPAGDRPGAQHCGARREGVR